MKRKAFAFLVHPRTQEDFFKKFPFFRILPRIIIDYLTCIMPPVVVSEITGLQDKKGHKIKGYIIAITMTARQMMKYRKKALNKIIQALEFAKKKDVGIIGLGALTASLTRGGLDLLEVSKDIKITTGRAYTVKTVTEYVTNVIQEFGFNKKTSE